MSGYNIRLITFRDAYEGLTAFYLCIVAGLLFHLNRTTDNVKSKEIVEYRGQKKRTVEKIRMGTFIAKFTRNLRGICIQFQYKFLRGHILF